jgi:hypothetical protein
MCLNETYGQCGFARQEEHIFLRIGFVPISGRAFFIFHHSAAMVRERAHVALYGAVADFVPLSTQSIDGFSHCQLSTLTLLEKREKINEPERDSKGILSRFRGVFLLFGFLSRHRAVSILSESHYVALMFGSWGALLSWFVASHRYYSLINSGVDRLICLFQRVFPFIP